MKRFLSLLLITSTCLVACQSTPSSNTGTTSDTTASKVTTTADPDKKPLVKEDYSHLFAPAERFGNVKVNEFAADGNYITGNYTTVSGETVQKYPRLTNLPTLYLEFPEGKSLSSVEHGVYTDATYTFVDEYVEHSYYNLPLQIKGRGNYSWSFQQKPYSIKLGEKADFLGMGAAKKWTLITVGSDKSMMHNYLTQKMAAAMGLRGTCENEYVDVVVNGVYKGTWVLTEKIQIHEERIDVPEEIGVLFEIEMVYRHSCDFCIELYDNKWNRSESVHLRLKTYKGMDIEDMDSRQRDAARAELQPFFDNITAVMTDSRVSLKKLEKYIDVDSFVNWYLLNEMTRNYDSKFVTSCYCFINEEGKLYMGPVWDFDTCYGIQTPDTDGYWVSQAPWYTWLLDCPEFFRRTQERWTELQDNGLLDSFHASIGQTAERIAQSEKLNHTLYPVSELRNDSFEGSVQFFQDWLTSRLEWMDSEFYIEGLYTDQSVAPPPAITTTTVTTTKRPARYPKS